MKYEAVVINNPKYFGVILSKSGEIIVIILDIVEKRTSFILQRMGDRN